MQGKPSVAGCMGRRLGGGKAGKKEGGGGVQWGGTPRLDSPQERGGFCGETVQCLPRALSMHYLVNSSRGLRLPALQAEVWRESGQQGSGDFGWGSHGP